MTTKSLIQPRTQAEHETAVETSYVRDMVLSRVCQYFEDESLSELIENLNAIAADMYRQEPNENRVWTDKFKEDIMYDFGHLSVFLIRLYEITHNHHYTGLRPRN